MGEEDSISVRDRTLSTDPDKAPPLPQRPKVIQSSSLGPAIRQIFLFQLPALAFTTALLVLYVKQISWNPTANQLGALLVAAKIHETLIIASLFHILYYHIRRGLLGRRGIPYGFLTAPFQLLSPFYLFTSEFWSGLRHANLHSALLALLVVVAFILSALTGASSGIIILPKLGWRALPESMEDLWSSTGRSIPGIAGYVMSTSTAVFISKIDLSAVPNNCMNITSGASSSKGCPFRDLTDSSAAIYTNFGEIGSWPETVNLSISSKDRRTISYYSSLEYGQLAVATTPLSSVENVFYSAAVDWFYSRHDTIKLAARLHNANGDAVTMKQPRVITQCSDTSTDIQGKETSSPYYDFRILRFFYQQFTFTVPMAVFQDALDSGTHLGFIDVNEYLPNSIKTSVAIWTRDSLDDEYISICLVDARWLESDPWLFPLDAGAKIQHTLIIDKNETTTYTNLKADNLIHIDPSWCNLLNQTLHSSASGSLSSNATSVFELLTQYLNNDDRSSFSTTTYNRLAAGLTIILAEALSLVPYNRGWRVEWSSGGPWKPDPNYNVDPPFSQIGELEDYTLLSAEHYQNVYAYDFGEITTILSWIVLFLHYLLVLVHLIVVRVHRGRTSSTWGRLGELVCLALNSRPSSLLTNTGAGVLGSQIWELNASVRDTGVEGRVELVLSNSKAPDDSILIQPDKIYG
jgi:hypothetical protein